MDEKGIQLCYVVMVRTCDWLLANKSLCDRHRNNTNIDFSSALWGCCFKCSAWCQTVNLLRVYVFVSIFYFHVHVLWVFVFDCVLCTIAFPLYLQTIFLFLGLILFIYSSIPSFKQSVLDRNEEWLRKMWDYETKSHQLQFVSSRISSYSRITAVKCTS